MKHIVLLAVLVVCATLVLPRLAAAQTAPAIPPSITTPDKVETRLGTLDFKDGMPSTATLDKGLRQSGLHARLRCVREHHAGREHGRHSQGRARRRRQGQRNWSCSPS